MTTWRQLRFGSAIRLQTHFPWLFILVVCCSLHWIKRNLPKIYFLLGCSNYTIKRHSSNKTIKSFKNTNEAMSIDLLWIVWMYETTMTINFKWKAKQILEAFLLALKSAVNCCRVIDRLENAFKCFNIDRIGANWCDFFLATTFSG